MVSPLSRVIGLLQVDSTVGDLAGNAKRLESLARTAKNNGAKLAIATELAICGYPPRDLLLQPDLMKLFSLYYQNKWEQTHNFEEINI